MKCVDVTRLFDAGDRVLVLPDMHIGWYENTAWVQVAMSLKAGELLGCNKVIHLGDLLDMYNVSPHRQAHDIPETFEETNHYHEAFIARIRMAGMEPTLRIEGNHDAESSWLRESGLGNAVRLTTLVPSLKSWRRTVKLGDWAWIANDLFAVHGDSLRGAGTVNSASSVLQKNPGLSVLYGHTHRLQVAYSTTTHPTTGKSTHLAATLGHLTSEDFDTGNRKLRASAATHALGCGLLQIRGRGRFIFNVGTYTQNNQVLFLHDQEVTATESMDYMVDKTFVP